MDGQQAQEAYYNRAASQAFQGNVLGALDAGLCPPPGGTNQAQSITPEYLAKMEAEQRAASLRYHRAEVLRMAFELVRGTDLATDHQAVIRAARDMLAFIDEG